MKERPLKNLAACIQVQQSIIVGCNIITPEINHHVLADWVSRLNYFCILRKMADINIDQVLQIKAFVLPIECFL